MQREQLARYLTVATNIGVLVGLVFVVIQLRQNNANLVTANLWAITQSSVAVWQPLVETEDFARVELKVRRRQPLSDVDSVRYEAYVWIRLEQVWTGYELFRQGVVSRADWVGTYEPTQDRAANFPFVAEVIRNGPMPEELKTLLLAKVKN